MSQTNRQILLVEKPTGKLSQQNFRMAEAAILEPKDGEVLVRVLYISLDAANRAWMQGATYRSAVDAGSVMAGGAIAEVVESKASGFAKGDLVFADTGWQEYAALPASALIRMPRVEPMTHLLSVYGIAGLTAYFGLLNVGEPKAGETIVVSAAAGSVGSIVGQIGRIKGCRVIGVAGGAEKCAWLKSELGFDEAVDYKAGNLYAALKAAAPKGIDVYFDNTGGEILEACLPLMNLKGRISCCGAVSERIKREAKKRASSPCCGISIYSSSCLLSQRSRSMTSTPVGAMRTIPIAFGPIAKVRTHCRTTMFPCAARQVTESRRRGPQAVKWAMGQVCVCPSRDAER